MVRISSSQNFILNMLGQVVRIARMVVITYTQSGHCDSKVHIKFDIRKFFTILKEVFIQIKV